MGLQRTPPPVASAHAFGGARSGSGDRSGSRGSGPAFGRGRALAGKARVTGLLLLGLLFGGCTSAQPASPASPAPQPASAATTTVVTSSEPLRPRPAEGPFDAATVKRLQKALDRWVAGGNGIGVTAAVLSPEGKWAGAAGVDGAGRALEPRSAMAIGSITKTFTAAEIMKLVGEGRMNLDAPIADYVDLPFDPEGATVRQVLAHRSGFPLDTMAEGLQELAGDLDRSWTAADILAQVDVDGARQGTVGGEHDYNNLNYEVLGLAIEKVAGEPFDVVIRRDLIEPAGLDRVWVQDAEKPTAPRAVARAVDWADLVDPDGPWLPSRSVATLASYAGGMAADAPSLARWAYELFGGYVIDSDLVTLMATPLGTDSPYGLGAGRFPDTNPSATGHGGGHLRDALVHVHLG